MEATLARVDGTTTPATRRALMDEQRAERAAKRRARREARKAKDEARAS
jgi:hypothetical protein